MSEYTFTAHFDGLPSITFALDLENRENGSRLYAEESHAAARSFIEDVRQGVPVYDEQHQAWTLTPDARLLGISSEKDR